MFRLIGAMISGVCVFVLAVILTALASNHQTLGWLTDLG